MKINITNTFGATAGRVRELGRQTIFASAVALTRTAQDVRPALKSEMSRSFSQPTSYTLNSLYVKPATKTSLEARVWLKDDTYKGTPAARYLSPEIDGGVRSQKGMERTLQRAGLLGASEFAVPAVGADLDGSGNVKRSQITQLMSQLKLQLRAGYQSKATDSKRSKRTVAKQGVTYFVLPKAHGRLKAGIYLKRRFAHGSAIRPVFLFVSKVGYQKRFRFYEVSEAVVRLRGPVHFSNEMAKAIATARLS